MSLGPRDESEGRDRSSGSGARVAALEAGTEGRILRANSAAVLLLDCDPVGRSLGDFFNFDLSIKKANPPAGDEAALLAGMFEDARREGPLRIASRLVRADGDRLRAELVLSVEQAGSGAEIYKLLVTAVRDDFDLRRREQNESYRSLIELSPDGIAIHTEGELVYLNPRAVHLIGAASAQELLGRPVLEFVPPDLRGFVRDRINRLVTTDDQAAMTEEIFMRTDGTPLPVEVTATRILFNDRPSVMVLFRDITARLQTESMLVRSEALLAEAQSIAQIGSWEWVFADDRWTWTEETYRLYEIPRDARLSFRSILKRIPLADRRRIRSAFRAAADGFREAFTYEHSLVRSDGSVRYLHGIARVEKGPDGKPLRMAGTIQDVTDRRRAENEVRQLNDELERRVRLRTAELEYANRELESFSYSVSHDLRAPLRAIDGFSQALAEDKADRLDAEGLDFLRRIRAGCDRMGNLIDSILDLSRLTRSELRVKRVNLSQLVEQLAAEERQTMEDPGRVDFIVQPEVFAACDERLMRVALGNLLDNAVKYSAREPRARIEFGVEETPGGSVYFMRDNGVGFDMMHAGRLFGVFQRMHAPEQFPGTGIGLATVQRIIHRHRGTIRAVALVGEGATFYFTLGLSPGEEEERNDESRRER